MLIINNIRFKDDYRDYIIYRNCSYVFFHGPDICYGGRSEFGNLWVFLAVKPNKLVEYCDQPKYLTYYKFLAEK